MKQSKTEKAVFAKLASQKVELSAADDIMDFVRNLSFDTGYIDQSIRAVERGTSEASRILKELTNKEKELKDFQSKANELGIKDEVSKAKNVANSIKQMKSAFRDMVKNGESALSALKSI